MSKFDTVFTGSISTAADIQYNNMTGSLGQGDGLQANSPGEDTDQAQAEYLAACEETYHLSTQVLLFQMNNPDAFYSL